MTVQRGEVVINGEDVLDIINQRNNFRAVLEGAEFAAYLADVQVRSALPATLVY